MTTTFYDGLTVRVYPYRLPFEPPWSWEIRRRGEVLMSSSHGEPTRDQAAKVGRKMARREYARTNERVKVLD